MTYQTVAIPIVGPTDQAQSRDQDYQLSKNYYSYPSDAGIALHGFPGSTLFSEFFSSAPDRGFHVFNNELYQVSGVELEKVASDGVRTQLGTISGAQRCIFDSDDTDLFIVTEGNVYRFNTTLTLLTDPDFETPNGVTYLNSQFIYDGDGQRWVSSEVGDGSDIRLDNYAEAETNPDDMVVPYAFEGKLYLFGQKSIEPWYFSDAGAPPFELLDTSVIQKGTNAPYSICSTDSFIYFLGDDLNVYQLRGNQVRSIANSGIAEEINSFSATDDAIGFCFNLKGLDFYYIAFEAGNRSFLFSEAANQWTTLSFGVDDSRHLASSYAFVYGKHLIADHRNGRVLEWDWDVNDDNGDVIQRQRIFPPITGEIMGIPGKRLQMNRIEIEMATGLGEDSTGADVDIDIEISTDSGHSWETLNTVSLGSAGQHDLKVEAYHVKTFRRATIRTTQTAAALSNMTGAAIDLKAGGF